MPPPLSPTVPHLAVPAGEATVLLEGGRRKAMRDLAIGDRVQVLTAAGHLAFEPVYLFGHKDGASWSSMLTLAVQRSETGTPAASSAGYANATLSLTLSPDHFVPVRGPSGLAVMTRAAAVKAGDAVWAAPGAGPAALHVVTSIKEGRVQGLFNPLTPAGTVVVDGVVASVHSKWFLDGFMDFLGLTHLVPTIYQVRSWAGCV